MISDNVMKAVAELKQARLNGKFGDRAAEQRKHAGFMIRSYAGPLTPIDARNWGSSSCPVCDLARLRGVEIEDGKAVAWWEVWQAVGLTSEEARAIADAADTARHARTASGHVEIRALLLDAYGLEEGK